MFWKKERRAETTDPLYDPNYIPADLLKYEKRERRSPRWEFGDSLVNILMFLALVVFCTLLMIWLQ
jgi:hypothetical protein